MKKESLAIIILSIILIILLSFALFKYKQMSSNISQLEQSNSNLLQERTQLKSDIDNCKAEKTTLSSDLSMLQEDVFKIKKSCMTENVCKSRFPGVRYKCNDFGEAHDDGNRICECNDNCEVVIQ